MRSWRSIPSSIYDLFPEKIVKDWPAPLNKIYVLNSIYSRSYMMLEDCVQDGFINSENAKDFNDVNLRIYKTILQDVQHDQLSRDEAIAMTMKYYFQLMECYMNSESSPLLKAAMDKLS